MNRTDREKIIKDLAAAEASLINKLYSLKRKDLAKECIHSAIGQFIEALEKEMNLKIMPSMDLEYRIFVVSLGCNIDKSYMPDAIPIILGFNV